jgi:hypothetical protein
MAENERQAPVSASTAGAGSQAQHSDLDLGTAGGGRIPGQHFNDTANKTVNEGSAPAQGRTPELGLPDTPGRSNTIDPTAQGNLGGRNPDQPQTAMGSGRDAPNTTGTRADITEQKAEQQG